MLYPVHLSCLEFPRFSGADVATWLCKCERIFELENTDDDGKVQLASIHFDGLAADWHENLQFKAGGYRILADWSCYRRELLQRFGKIEQDGDAQSSEIADLCEDQRAMNLQFGVLSKQIDEMLARMKSRTQTSAEMDTSAAHEDVPCTTSCDQHFPVSEPLQEEETALTAPLSSYTNSDGSSALPVPVLLVESSIREVQINTIQSVISPGTCTFSCEYRLVNCEKEEESVAETIMYCSIVPHTQSVRQNVSEALHLKLPPAKPPDDFMFAQSGPDNSWSKDHFTDVVRTGVEIDDDFRALIVRSGAKEHREVLEASIGRLKVFKRDGAGIDMAGTSTAIKNGKLICYSLQAKPPDECLNAATMLCSNKVSTLDLCTILSPTFKVNPEFCTTVVDLWYVSSKFISIKEDVGNNSVLASSRKLQELNNSVTISSIPSSLAKERLSDFQDVVFTDISLDKAREYNDYCHSHQPLFAFLTFEVRGLFGEVFCDFDLNFTVFDVDGNEPHSSIIATIRNANLALVPCVTDEILEFHEGDLVVFSEDHGMTEFNDGNAGFDALDVLYRHRQQKALPSGEGALSRVDINTDEEDVNVMKGTVRAPSPPFTTVWIMKHKDMHWAISPIGSVPITATLSRPLGRNQQQMRLTKRANTWEPTKHVVEYVLFYAHIDNFFDRGVGVRVLDPRSYTREDVGEIQGNGSAVCMQRLLRARIHGGARLAKLDDAAQAFVHFMKACVNLNQGAAFIMIKESDSLIDSNVIKWCNSVAGKFQLLYMTPTAGKFQLLYMTPTAGKFQL